MVAIFIGKFGAILKFDRPTVWQESDALSVIGSRMEAVPAFYHGFVEIAILVEFFLRRKEKRKEGRQYNGILNVIIKRIFSPAQARRFIASHNFIISPTNVDSRINTLRTT